MNRSPDDRPSRGFTIFAAIVGAGIGYLVGGFAGTFVEMFGGAEGRGVFMLAWLLGGLGVFAWLMGLATRMRAGRRIRAEAWRRVGDIDYEPPGGIPKLPGRSSRPSAEQRMAGYLKAQAPGAAEPKDDIPSV